MDRAMSRFVEQVHFASKFKKREINGCPVWMGWERFVDHALQKFEECASSVPNNAKGASSLQECIHHNNEIGWSVYAPSLQAWFKEFDPSNVLVIYTVDLSNDPRGVLEVIENYVGVSNFRGYNNVNSTANKQGSYGWGKVQKTKSKPEGTSRQKMPGETYAKLHDFYKPHMIHLQSMALEGLMNPLPAQWIVEWHLDK